MVGMLRNASEAGKVTSEMSEAINVSIDEYGW